MNDNAIMQWFLLPEAGICEMWYSSIMQFWVICLVDNVYNHSQLEWCNWYLISIMCRFDYISCRFSYFWCIHIFSYLELNHHYNRKTQKEHLAADLNFILADNAPVSKQ